jgi:glycosyltransferase involved in cell wall biosynthesis
MNLKSMAVKSLEIAILSFNKSGFTLDLLNSILKYEANTDIKISILDQGSRIEEIEKLEEGIVDPRVKLLKNGRNLGVSGGRQFQLMNSDSEWILFLDNDLILNSPIYKACLKIMEIGNFACLPFNELRKGNHTVTVIPQLYITKLSNRKYEDSFGLGGEVESPSRMEHPFEITGIAGGVLLANVNTLRNLGGIKGPGKAGFEDLDLSLRIQKANEKVYLVDIERPVFHNKVMSQETPDKLTELTRLNPKQLRLNAKYIEYKHHGHVWGMAQLEWITKRAIDSKIQLGVIQALLPDFNIQKSRNANPKVLLICDSPGWAFDRIAQKQKIYLAKWFDITVTYTKDWNALKIFLFEYDWDAIVFLWRAPLFQLVREGVLSEDLVAKISYCIYDHQGNLGYEQEILFLESRKVPVGVVNKRLFNDLKSFHSLLFHIPDGVDTGLFKPFKTSERKKIRIGWSGNTKWGGVDDVKGYGKIIRPVMDVLGAHNEFFEFDIIDSSQGKLPQDEVAMAMKKWDVVICLSEHEGTPNPVLEGLAMGLIVVSTPVGMTSELNAAGAKIRIIDRDPEALIVELTEIASLKLNKQVSVEGKRNREIALEYDWRRVLKHHKAFILASLER